STMLDEARKVFLQGKLVALCEAVLAEEIGIIAPSRRIHRLVFQLPGTRDDEFNLFVAIDSDTDHLPVDRERRNWSTEALERKDKEIAEAESFYKDQVAEQCKSLL